MHHPHVLMHVEAEERPGLPSRFRDDEVVECIVLREGDANANQHDLFGGTYSASIASSRDTLSNRRSAATICIDLHAG